MVPQGLSRPREGGHSVASSTPKSRLQAGVERAREATKAGITSLLVLVGATGVAGQAKAQEVKPVVEITTDANNIDIRSFQVADNGTVVIQMASIPDGPKITQLPKIISMTDDLGQLPKELQDVLKPIKDTYEAALKDGKRVIPGDILGFSVIDKDNAHRFTLNDGGLAQKQTFKELTGFDNLVVQDNKNTSKVSNYKAVVEALFKEDPEERRSWRRDVNGNPISDEMLAGEIKEQNETRDRYLYFPARTMQQMKDGRLRPDTLKAFESNFNTALGLIKPEFYTRPYLKQLFIDVSSATIYNGVLNDEEIAKLDKDDQAYVAKKREEGFQRYLTELTEEKRKGRTDEQMKALYFERFLSEVNNQRIAMAEGMMDGYSKLFYYEMGSDVYGKIMKTEVSAKVPDLGNIEWSSKHLVPATTLFAKSQLPFVKGRENVVSDGTDKIFNRTNMEGIFGGIRTSISLAKNTAELAKEKEELAKEKERGRQLDAKEKYVTEIGELYQRYNGLDAEIFKIAVSNVKKRDPGNTELARKKMIELADIRDKIANFPYLQTDIKSINGVKSFTDGYKILTQKLKEAGITLDEQVSMKQ